MERYYRGYKISSYKGYGGKSYSRRPNKGKSFIKKLLVQTFICILVVLTILLLKSLNLPFSNTVINNVENALNSEMSFKNTWSEIRELPNVLLDKASGAVPVYNSEKKLNLVMPLKGVIVSSYGEKLNPYNDSKTFQRGIEIKTEGLRIVKTVEDGVVVKTGENEIYGRFIKVQHSENLFSIYGNLCKVYTKADQRIIRGERIAELSEDSPVLHFELWVNDDAVNPLQYFNDDGLI